MSDHRKSYLTSEDVQEILRLLESSTFNALDLEIGDMRLKLRRGSEAPWPDPVEQRPPKAPSGEAAGVRPMPATLPGGSAAPGAAEICAPMLGTYYRAPRPGAEPFVSVGAAVTPQTTVGIIEVMKLMNAVLAGVEGEVVEICVEDGTLVEYDQVLMRVARPT